MFGVCRLSTRIEHFLVFISLLLSVMSIFFSVVVVVVTDKFFFIFGKDSFFRFNSIQNIVSRWHIMEDWIFNLSTPKKLENLENRGKNHSKPKRWMQTVDSIRHQNSTILTLFGLCMLLFRLLCINVEYLDFVLRLESDIYRFLFLVDDHHH